MLEAPLTIFPVSKKLINDNKHQTKDQLTNMKQKQCGSSFSFRTFHATALSYEMGRLILDKQIPPWSDAKPYIKQNMSSGCLDLPILEILTHQTISHVDKTLLWLYSSFEIMQFHPWSRNVTWRERFKLKMVKDKASNCCRLTDLMHNLRNLRAEVFPAMVVEYLLQRYVLKCNQGRLQHVETSLVRKRENGHRLQKFAAWIRWIQRWTKRSDQPINLAI